MTREERWRLAVDRYFAPAGMALADEEIAEALAGRVWGPPLADQLAAKVLHVVVEIEDDPDLHRTTCSRFYEDSDDCTCDVGPVTDYLRDRLPSVIAASVQSTLPAAKTTLKGQSGEQQ